MRERIRRDKQYDFLQLMQSLKLYNDPIDFFFLNNIEGFLWLHRITLKPNSL